MIQLLKYEIFVIYSILILTALHNIMVLYTLRISLIVYAQNLSSTLPHPPQRKISFLNVINNNKKRS